VRKTAFGSAIAGDHRMWRRWSRIHDHSCRKPGDQHIGRDCGPGPGTGARHAPLEIAYGEALRC
jgi:hypothetical protein